MGSSTLVTSHTGTSLLIDMPPQFKMAWDTGGFDQSALLGILITHRHEDHTLGLKYLVDAHPRNGVTDPHPIAAWMPQEVEEQWFGRTPPARGCACAPRRAHAYGARHCVHAQLRRIRILCTWSVLQRPLSRLCPGYSSFS